MTPRTETQERHRLRWLLAKACGERLLDRGQDGILLERYYGYSSYAPVRKIVARNRAALPFVEQLQLMLPA